jgi:hypothetical protein
LVRAALRKLRADKPVEALHLTDVALSYDPNNNAALRVRLRALSYLQERSQNYIESGWLDYGIRKTTEKLRAQ